MCLLIASLVLVKHSLRCLPSSCSSTSSLFLPSIFFSCEFYCTPFRIIRLELTNVRWHFPHSACKSFQPTGGLTTHHLYLHVHIHCRGWLHSLSKSHFSCLQQYHCHQLSPAFINGLLVPSKLLLRSKATATF